jgi:hypothetical protein
LCGGPIDPADRSNFQRITGWDRPRSGGGTNHVVFREYADPPEYAHDDCVWRRQHHLPPTTWPTLFDEEEVSS